MLGAGILGVLLALLLSDPASAAPVGASVPAAGPMLAVYTLPQVITHATKWLLGIMGVLSVFFLTLAGTLYMSAGGDPSSAERAKQTLKNVCIGYSLAILAPVILIVLNGILGKK